MKSNNEGEVLKKDFDFHLQNGGNDFANWIEGVFYLKDLAAQIRLAKKARDVVKIIDDYALNKEKIDAKIKSNLELEKKTQENLNEIVKKNLENKNLENKKNELNESDKDDKNLDGRNESLTSLEKNRAFEMSKAELLESTVRFGQESDLLDEKTKKMKKMSRIDKKEYELSISKINENYNQLYVTLVEARKKGCDMFMSDLKMRNLKSKIAYAEFSNKPEDLIAITELLDYVKQEIVEESAKERLNVKDEILIAAGLKKKEESES